MYTEVVENLKSISPENRETSAEYIRDLYEDKFQYSSPPDELVHLFTDGLVNAIILEDKEDIQYKMLDALFAWAWFPVNENYYGALVNNFKSLLSNRNIGYALRVLIASGSEKYKVVYEQYIHHADGNIQNIALEGVRSLESNL